MEFYLSIPSKENIFISPKKKSLRKMRSCRDRYRVVFLVVFFFLCKIDFRSELHTSLADKKDKREQQNATPLY